MTKPRRGGAFSLAPRGTWTNCADELPPDDYTPIELRFDRDPVPLITNGRIVRRIWDVWGKPAIAVYWRLLVAH